MRYGGTVLETADGSCENYNGGTVLTRETVKYTISYVEVRPAAAILAAGQGLADSVYIYGRKREARYETRFLFRCPLYFRRVICYNKKRRFRPVFQSWKSKKNAGRNRALSCRFFL